MAERAPKDFFGREIVTVDALERLTPAERRESFEESVVTDVGQVPPAFLARVRARLEPLIAERDREQASALRAPRPGS
jgi:hypothetical protein